MKTSLKKQAYQEIKSKILSCEYAPNTFINEDFLCRELNVSRTPIRDALGRLEQENLVEIMSKKGVMIAPLTVNVINVIYETRVLLEPYILSTYGHKINDLQLNQLNHILDDKNTDNIKMVYHLDDEFHRIIVNICENKYLIQCYDNIHAQNTRLRIMSGNQNKERIIETQNEHKVILNHLFKKEFVQAAKALETHLLSAKEAAFKVLFSSECSI